MLSCETAAIRRFAKETLCPIARPAAEAPNENVRWGAAGDLCAVGVELVDAVERCNTLKGWWRDRELVVLCGVPE